MSGLHMRRCQAAAASYCHGADPAGPSARHGPEALVLVCRLATTGAGMARDGKSRVHLCQRASAAGLDDSLSERCTGLVWLAARIAAEQYLGLCRYHHTAPVSSV